MTIIAFETKRSFSLENIFIPENCFLENDLIEFFRNSDFTDFQPKLSSSESLTFIAPERYTRLKHSLAHSLESFTRKSFHEADADGDKIINGLN